MFICQLRFYKTYYYFILFWVFELVNEIEKEIFDNNLKNVTDIRDNSNSTMRNNTTNINIFANKNENNYPDNSKEITYLYLFVLNLGDLLSGFLIIYTKIKMNFIKKHKEKINNHGNIELIYTDLSKKRNKYILILLINMFYFVF